MNTTLNEIVNVTKEKDLESRQVKKNSEKSVFPPVVLGFPRATDLVCPRNTCYCPNNDFENHRSRASIFQTACLSYRKYWLLTDSQITFVEGPVRDRIKKAEWAFFQLSPVWRLNQLSLRTNLRIFNSDVKLVLL